MKYYFFRVMFVVIAVCMSVTANCQQSKSYYSKDPHGTSVNSPTTYLGVGLGVNSIGILGGSIEGKFHEKVSLAASAGLGTWGYKLTAGGRYYFSDRTAIGISYALATGLSKVRLNLENSSGNKQDINMQLLPVHLINITYHKFWKLGKGNSRFGVEAGYSISLSPIHQYKVLDQSVILSDNSVRVMNVLQPGGLILGINFTFGR